MKHSRDKQILGLAVACGRRKVDMVTTPTGAIVIAGLYKSGYQFKASYKDGKVTVSEKGKIVKVLDISKPAKQKGKKADKKEPENDKAI